MVKYLPSALNVTLKFHSARLDLNNIRQSDDFYSYIYYSVTEKIYQHFENYPTKCCPVNYKEIPVHQGTTD